MIEIYENDDYSNIYNINDKVIDISDYLTIIYIKRVTLYMKIQAKQINKEEFSKEDNELIEKLKKNQNILIEETIDNIRDLFRKEKEEKGKTGNYLNLLKTIVNKYPYLDIEKDKLNIDELYKKNKNECLNKLLNKYYHFHYPNTTSVEREKYQLCVEIECQLNSLSSLINS